MEITKPKSVGLASERRFGRMMVSQLSNFKNDGCPSRRSLDFRLRHSPFIHLPIAPPHEYEHAHRNIQKVTRTWPVNQTFGDMKSRRLSRSARSMRWRNPSLTSKLNGKACSNNLGPSPRALIKNKWLAPQSFSPHRMRNFAPLVFRAPKPRQ